MATPYRLQLLHGSDFEAGLRAVATDGGGPTARAANFAAIVDRLDDQVDNTIILSGGDNFLPGPVYAAAGDPALNSTYTWVYNQLFKLPLTSAGLARDANGDGVLDAYNDLRASPGRADITLLNIIGVQASALGNHDFDSGPRELSLIARQEFATPAGPAGDRWVGAQFPYLSANLNFSADPDMAPAFTNQIREWTAFATGPAQTLATSNNNQPKFAPSTIITEGGEKIAVVGATTQLLATISSPQAVRVVDAAGNTIPSADNMAVLAAQINAETARIKASDPTINKFVLASHLQVLANEKALAPLLNDIDIVLAAGSHTLAADSNDPLRSGERAVEPYPILTRNAAGKDAVIVVGTGEYAHVGRLVVDFDANGDLIRSSLNPAENGAIATTWGNVKAVYGLSDDAAAFNAAFAPGSKGYLAQAMIEGANLSTGQLGIGTVAGSTQGLADILRAKDGNVFGRSDVYLNGLRVDVRTQETNLGNLSADANLWYAKFYDPSVVVSLKNGGGIRDSIGSSSAAGGATTVTLGPTAANPDAGKQAGDISQLDIENSLRFNNALSLVTVTAQNFERLMEWSVAGSGGGATQGRFPQLGGVVVAYDWGQTPIAFNSTTGAVTTEGARIRSLALTNEAGAITSVLVENGQFVGDPNQPIRMVTLNFLAGNPSQPIFGGDGYPIPLFTQAGSRLDLLGAPSTPATLPAAATFAAAGSEQDAFAEYMRANFSTTAFNQPDTPVTGDTRQFNQTATSGADVIVGLSLAEALNGLGGNDVIRPGGGNDTVNGGAGVDTVQYAQGRAGVTITRNGDALLQVSGGPAVGTDTLIDVETVRLADGAWVMDLTGTTSATVYRLFQAVFDRTPDEAGFRFWAGIAQSSGPQAVATAFFNAPEYATKWGAGASAAQVVERLYRGALDRAPDAAGATFWTDALSQGRTTREQMAVDFANAPEAIALLLSDAPIPGYWTL